MISTHLQITFDTLASLLLHGQHRVLFSVIDGTIVPEATYLSQSFRFQI